MSDLTLIWLLLGFIATYYVAMIAVFLLIDILVDYECKHNLFLQSQDMQVFALIPFANITVLVLLVPTAIYYRLRYGPLK